MNFLGRLLRWFGVGLAEHFRKRAIEYLLGLLASLTAIAAAIKAVRDWLEGQAVCMVHGSCRITGPRLTALISGVYLLVIALGVLAVRFWRSRARVAELERQAAEAARARPASFARVRVEDQRYKLTWFIKRPPTDWLDWATQYRYTPADVASVIDGPYHGEGCSGRLREDLSRHDPAVDPDCPVCGAELWTPMTEDYEPTRLGLFYMRWQVLQELQRLHHNGNPLTSTVVLDKPEYWKSMTPYARPPVRS